MKLRLAALARHDPAQRLPPRRRHHRRERRRRLCRPQRLPDRRRSRRAPATSPCSIPPDSTDSPRDRRHRGDHRRARDLPGRRAMTSSRPRPSRRRAAPRCRARRGRSSCPISTSRCSGGTQVAAKQVGQAVLELRGRRPPRAGPGSRRRSGSIAARRRLPANVRADPDPSAQGRRGRGGGRSAGRSGGRARRSPTRPSSIWSASS